MRVSVNQTTFPITLSYLISKQTDLCYKAFEVHTAEI